MHPFLAILIERFREPRLAEGDGRSVRSASRRRARFLLAALIPQVVVGAIGVWLLADTLRSKDPAWGKQNNLDEVMTSLNSTLTEAERNILFAVIAQERLHPSVPVAFHNCISQLRKECQIARENASIPDEADEVKHLSAAVERMARLGEGVLAAPADERWSRYCDPDSGFQSAVTSALKHMSEIRKLNELVSYSRRRAAQDSARQAILVFAGVVGLSLLFTAVVLWRLGRVVNPAKPTNALELGTEVCQI